MVTESIDIISRGLDTTMAVLPAIVGALIVLLIGWIAGRLLGKGVRILLDKVTAAPVIGDSDFGKSITRSGITIGYLGDIAVRCIVYLIAVLAAVNILNLDYLSQFMMKVIEYIPHVLAFVIILVVGVILTDYFIDMFQLYSRSSKIRAVQPCTCPDPPVPVPCCCHTGTFPADAGSHYHLYICYANCVGDWHRPRGLDRYYRLVRHEEPE